MGPFIVTSATKFEHVKLVYKVKILTYVMYSMSLNARFFFPSFEIGLCTTVYMCACQTANDEVTRASIIE